MKYLVDANVLSEPTKPSALAKVETWLKAQRHESLTCAPVIGEIWRGIHALPAGRKKSGLEAWFRAVRRKLTSLDWTTGAAKEWAEMVNRVKQSGSTVGVLDTQIAAIAKHHDLTVATRNADDFTRCGVAVVNPFA